MRGGDDRLGRLQEAYDRGDLDSVELLEDRSDGLLTLNTRSTLPEQIWMSPGPEDGPAELEPKAEEFDPIGENRLCCKPHGGMWTSTHTLDAEHATDWIRWCSTDGFMSGRHMWRLSVKDDLDIIEVDDLDDLIAVVQRFENEDYGTTTALRDRAIDFRFMAEEYDAMRLTKEGQKRTRMTDMGEPDLYGWDAESTLWFRWAFEEVEYHGYCDTELPDWRTPD